MVVCSGLLGLTLYVCVLYVGVCVEKRDITVTTLRAFLSINQGRVHLSSNKASEEGWRETEMEAEGGLRCVSGVCCC